MPPVARSRRGSVQYGEAREALLSAAVRVVAAQGLRNLTYRAVGREAGVTHTLVAHYFGSVDALLEQALRQSLQESVGSISLRPGSGDLDALIDGMATTVARSPDDQAFQYEVILQSRRRPELQPLVRAIYDAYIAELKSELTQAGLDPDPAFTHLAYSAANGLVFHQLTLGDSEMTANALQRLRECFESLDRA